MTPYELHVAECMTCAVSPPCLRGLRLKTEGRS
jgi:hypothetical protein